MNVIIDGQSLLGKRTGIGRYTYCLAEALRDRPDTRVFVLFNQLIRINRFKALTQEIKVRYANVRYPYKVIRRFWKPNFFYQIPIDIGLKWTNEDTVFHGTNFVTLPTRKARKVITIHDLAFMLYPETTDEKIYRHHMKWVPYSAHEADHIIAVSEHTKQDIMKLLGVSESKISVVYSAADARFQPQSKENIASARQKYRLPERYVLYVGTLEPRKNIPVLLEAFALAKRKDRFPEKLVIVGAKGWKYHPIFETVRKSRLQEDVIFTEYVNEEDLPAIYGGASLFAFPSLYEGFGLPVLEAMQAGVPVLASDISSIPEVAGDAAVLISPHSVEGWSENISQILQDEELRLQLKNKGLERSRRFSWRRVAEETIEVYRLALNRNMKLNRMIGSAKKTESASL